MPITNHPISLLRTLTPSELLSVATGLGHHVIQFSATPSETCSWQLLSRTWLLASGRGTQEPSPIRTINHMEVEGCYTVLATKPSSTLVPRSCWRPGMREKLWLQHLRSFRSMCLDLVLLVWVRMHHDEQSGASPKTSCGGWVRQENIEKKCTTLVEYVVLC